MESIDVCVGTRLHGNMAAIAAGTPGCVISHDSRTDELAETMGLPRCGASRLLETSGLSPLLESIRFNAEQFDRVRSEKRAVYIQKLSNLGIATSFIES